MNFKKCFPGFVNKAFTLSFDDGIVQDRQLIALFKKYQLKATININSGLFEGVWTLKYGENTQQHIRISAAEAAELYKGFEIAAHTVTHPTLTTLAFEDIKREVLEDKKALEQLFGTEVKGMAYPNGPFDDRTANILRGLGMAYARTIQATGTFALPEDFLKWHPTCHMFDAMKYADEFLQENKEELALFYVWGHSYELDRFGGKWAEFEAFCRAISGKDTVWYAENIELCEYINALNALTFADDGKPVNNSGITLYLNIDGKNIII